MTNISGGGLAVGAKSAHKQAAYDFIRWMTKEAYKYTQEIPALKKVDGKALLEQFLARTKT